ncbi:MAG TPA: hypothetical protein VK706_12340, partial [Candidatus Sulfotelmatobacter sp.]|nr:hypothetical protein [Candidatus Sulfotelmatobacter sp.]
RRFGRILVRILLVDPVEECAGVIVIETVSTNMCVGPTPEEVEHVRADEEQRRAGTRNTGDNR